MQYPAVTIPLKRPVYTVAENTLNYMPNHMVYIRYDDSDVNVGAFKIHTQAQHNQQGMNSDRRWH